MHTRDGYRPGRLCGSCALPYFGLPKSSAIGKARCQECPGLYCVPGATQGVFHACALEPLGNVGVAVGRVDHVHGWGNGPAKDPLAP